MLTSVYVINIEKFDISYNQNISNVSTGFAVSLCGKHLADFGYEVERQE